MTSGLSLPSDTVASKVALAKYNEIVGKASRSQSAVEGNKLTIQSPNSAKSQLQSRKL